VPPLLVTAAARGVQEPELRRYVGRTVVVTPTSPLNSVRAWDKFTPPTDSE